MANQSKNPFLRWSFLRMLLGMPRLLKTWQVGDGREKKLEEFVLRNAPKGDARGTLQAIDEFAYTKSYLINVGDEKGQILDRALEIKKPSLILELGTYCGYSALRMAIAAPSAKIISIEFNAENAKIAKAIHGHAGVGDRIDVVVGTLGDGGKTIQNLRQNYQIDKSKFDVVFIDHDKSHYLPDLKLLLSENLLSSDAVVVADNVGFPGAPDYLSYMDENEGKLWRTIKHETHLEYQNVLKDLVLVSQKISA